MFKIAILCLFFYTISGLELKPSCKTCKWFIPGNNVKNPDYGLCKMFKNTYGAGVAGKASLFIKDANLLGSYIDKKIDNEQKYVELD